MEEDKENIQENKQNEISSNGHDDQSEQVLSTSFENPSEPKQAEQTSTETEQVTEKEDEGSASVDIPVEAESEEEEDLTGIEEASTKEIFQKVTKKEIRKKRRKRSDKQDKDKESPEWIEKVVQIRRVTKVVKGGKKLSFRAVAVVGNAKGQVGVGVGKALEVIGAIQKAIVDAKKNLVTVPFIKATIPHAVLGRAGAAKVILKPAREGTGIKAGGAARTVLELGGIGDILSKSLGARSPLNVARATIDGITKLRKFEEVSKLRGLTVKEMIMAG